MSVTASQCNAIEDGHGFLGSFMFAVVILISFQISFYEFTDYSFTARRFRFAFQELSTNKTSKAEKSPKNKKAQEKAELGLSDQIQKLRSDIYKLERQESAEQKEGKALNNPVSARRIPSPLGCFGTDTL